MLQKAEVKMKSLEFAAETGPAIHTHFLILFFSSIYYCLIICISVTSDILGNEVGYK